MAKPSDIDRLTLPELISSIHTIDIKIKEHERLKKLYGGDYVWRDKQRILNKNIENLQIRRYHYVIKRNSLLKALLNAQRDEQYALRRQLGIKARYKR